MSEIDTPSISHGTHMTIGTCGYYARNYLGVSNSNSQTVGTIMFIQNGIPRMTFTNISDPYGLAKLGITKSSSSITLLLG
ncbi:MAG: hypothetical protein WCF23_20430 [Candidatus Nitrosopolaris sp.]